MKMNGDATTTAADASPLREATNEDAYARRRVAVGRAKRRAMVESSSSSSEGESDEDAAPRRVARRGGRRWAVLEEESESEESDSSDGGSESESVCETASDSDERTASPPPPPPPRSKPRQSLAPLNIGRGDASSEDGGARPMRLKGNPAVGGAKFELHASLASRLYDHQREGVRWMWWLQCNARGGILADDMGLGKTLQTCAFVAGVLRSGAAERVLVLAPTTLLPHWAKEFETCGLRSGKTLFKYYGASRAECERQLKACTSGRGVLLTSYGMVTSRAHALGVPTDDDEAEKAAAREGRGRAPTDFTGAFRWDWVVMDEGHKLKSTMTQLAQRVRQLPANLRMIVTGTPIQNDLGELWSLYDLTCPGLLGGENEFRRQFVHKITAGQAASATQKQRSEAKELGATLRQLTRPYFLRREKSEVLAKKEDDAEATRAPKDETTTTTTTSWKNVKNAPSALGQKNDLIAWIPLEPAQMTLYTKFLASKPVRDAANKTGSAISCMNTLKKICDHPSLCVGGTPVEEEQQTADDPLDDVDGDDAELKKSCAGEAAAAVAAAVRQCAFDDDALERGAPSVSSKSKFLMAMLERFGAEGHRTLVFSQSQAMLDIVEANVRAANIDFVRVDGKVNVEERDRRVTEFRSRDDIPVMLLTARVGGLGLTLTEATRVIIYDPAWNPTTDNQSVDRAYRIGQTKDVVVYRLITCGTVEEKIYRRQVFKGGLSKAGAEGGNSTRYFGADDASQLFETSEKALETSDTMKTLNALHAADRKWTDDLRKELAYVETLPFVSGVSDHDQLFSKDDDAAKTSNKASASSANKSATSKQAPAGGATTPKGKASGGAWKNVNSGWGGSDLLGGALLAALTPPKQHPASPMGDVVFDEESPEHVSGEAKLKSKIDAIQVEIDKQGVILSMPDVVAKIPDKGESVRKAIEIKLAEKRVLEAEYAAKYDATTESTHQRHEEKHEDEHEDEREDERAPSSPSEAFFTPAGSPESTLETARSLSRLEL